MSTDISNKCHVNIHIKVICGLRLLAVAYIIMFEVTFEHKML